MIMKTFASLAAAAAATLALAAPASAQDEVSTQVDIAGLDPASPADAAEIQRRIAAAARRVCGAPDSRTVTAIAQVETCRATIAVRSGR
jgi:UrcA family protein